MCKLPFIQLLAFNLIVCASSATAQENFIPTVFDECKKTENAAISGHNDRPGIKGDVNECIKRCAGETKFVCRSFDFNKKAKSCDLSSKNKGQVGGLKRDYENNPYDYYERKIPGSQSYANAYAHWDTNKPQKSAVWNVDQQIWINRPANEYQWVMTWSWEKDKKNGGYIGFNQSESGRQQILFSIWNATDCQRGSSGSKCLGFSGEGSGKSVRMPFNLSEDKYYRLRIWRLEADNSGQWWGGWIIEQGKDGKLVEHHIGNLRVEKQLTDINANSINDFIEFFGAPVADCRKIRQSTAGFTPPALNYQDKGAYEYYMHRTSSDIHRNNLCYPDRTLAGVNVTAEKYDFGFAKGTMIQMGGSNARHAPVRTKPPKDMPDS